MIRRFHVYLTLILSLLLGVHRGNLALWTDPAGEPDIIFPWPVTCLPDRDRALLEQGIQIQSNAQLQALLEDYLS